MAYMSGHASKLGGCPLLRRRLPHHQPCHRLQAQRPRAQRLQAQRLPVLRRLLPRRLEAQRLPVLRRLLPRRLKAQRLPVLRRLLPRRLQVLLRLPPACATGQTSREQFFTFCEVSQLICDLPAIESV